MVAVNQELDLLARIADLQRQIDDLRKRVGLSSAILANGLSIRTAEDGPRVEINSGAIEIVGDSTSPGAPHVNITADDDADHYARLWAALYGAGTQVDLSVRRASDGVIDGGKVLLWADAAVFAHQPDAGGEIMIGLGFPYGGLITIRGKWADYQSADPDDALFTGSVPFGSAGTGGVFSYGPTMASPMAPVTAVFDNPATPYAHVVSASSTTGFTVLFAASSNGPYEINFWCFRQ